MQIGKIIAIPAISLLLRIGVVEAYLCTNMVYLGAATAYLGTTAAYLAHSENKAKLSLIELGNMYFGLN